MSLAFWRRKHAAVDAAPRSSRSTADDDTGRADPTAALRTRARRRLIGAAALLLLAVVVVPMLLDPEPRPVPDNIPIDIPSEKTKFSPRLALPPVPATDNVPVTPPPDAPPPAAKSSGGAVAAKSSAATEKTPTAEPPKTDAPRSEAAKTDEDRARAVLEGKSSAEKLPATVKGGKFAVQAAATANEASARELAERLKKAGLAPYTERIDTAEGTRFRVRVGPYGSREDADRARARLKGMGINGNVVSA
ncbi:MAG TPA: SPOR domain-containing protein [Burkholderiaceae bacterium]|nr:SPOR domain-containing protein [Burkholderiaceae bacterium]